MSEENTTENQAPIDPDQSFPDPEEGELSEDDLEATAGGCVRFRDGITFEVEMVRLEVERRRLDPIVPVPPHLLPEGP